MISATRSDRVRDGDGRYDFERLERSVEFLIHEHERLSAEREALLGELLDREHRIASLESKLEGERALRATAVESVNKILSRLEQLQASVRPVEEPGR
jgi:chromosome segregation ATPase